MGLNFKWFKKKDKEEENKMTTLEQVRKAYEDLSDEDKKSFHQSLSDRVHESIAAQERADGNEDSQSAEAREHEALGEEHAEGKGETEELHESDDTAEEKKEDKADESREDKPDIMSEILSRLSALEAKSKETTEDTEDKEAAEKAEQIYGLGNDVFQAAKKEDGKVTAKEAAEEVKKLKI